MHIRAGLPSDAAVIVEMNMRLAWETERKQLDRDVLAHGVARVLMEPAIGRYWVACDGERVIGQLMLTSEWSDWRCAFFWWIQSVFVDDARRGRGVYGALHTHVLAAARAAGDVAGVRLYVEIDNVRARRTYERLGMSKMYDMMEQSVSVR